jgi:hypothetical protein
MRLSRPLPEIRVFFGMNAAVRPEGRTRRPMVIAILAESLKWPGRCELRR